MTPEGLAHGLFRVLADGDPDLAAQLVAWRLDGRAARAARRVSEAASRAAATIEQTPGATTRS